MGCRLVLLHPEVAGRSCGDCQKWMYDDTVERMGRRTIRGGRPVERIKDQNPPCHRCPKVPEGTSDPSPSSAVELSERNWEAYKHYLECRAVGTWPDDPSGIVRRNAMLIRQVEDAAHESRVENSHVRGVVLGMMRAKGR